MCSLSRLRGSRLVEDDQVTRGEVVASGATIAGRWCRDFRDPQAAWTVPARVVPNSRGTEFLMTFFQPSALSDDEFDRKLPL